MSEHQNIEYKQIWHDDYLKWVCGFANAQGGLIYIGKDDNGKVVGVENYKKLMEEIPNKIHDLLGLIVEVNLKKSNSLNFIEIIVPEYSVPISCRGRYYYRSGSTKRELTGSALNEFLLKKMGKTWDEVIESRAKLSDIDKKSIEIFLKAAAKAKRFPVDETLSLKDLLVKLQLIDKGKLKRAAVVLFAKEPMKFFPSMCVRIGRFGESKVDLRFQESIEGNLIHCLQETIELLDHKFLISPISFEGIHRIEKWQYPLPALREVLLNALIHKNYMGAHIQIEVYDDKICFWNSGGLPEDLSIEQLKKQHSSNPRNPFIADVCFKGGYIDAWGRGIEKIINACKEANLPAPEFEENSGGMLVTLFYSRSKKDRSGQEPESQPELQPDSQPESLRMRVLGLLGKSELSKSGISIQLGQKKISGQLNVVIRKLLEQKFVELTIPGKLISRNQKYRLTEKGKLLIK
ncbi:MAG: putative DNA binding domain-containing protein [Candidatus Omnitrophica bacterium]|nr:putative DNA binding domain-containing protein [Candidatus Omnitrophota bacterium]